MGPTISSHAKMTLTWLSNSTIHVQDRTDRQKVMENTSHTRNARPPSCVDSSHPDISMKKPPSQGLWNHSSFGTALRSMIAIYTLACKATLRPCPPAKIEELTILHRRNWPGAMRNSSICATENCTKHQWLQGESRGKHGKKYGHVSPTLGFFHMFSPLPSSFLLFSPPPR